MKISVLLSLYSKENSEFFRQSFDSIIDQTLHPDEIVLVEDGPLTDELYKVIREYSTKYSNIKIIKLNKNGGVGNALREGLKHCTNELVARMDTDDIAKPDRFEKQVQFMEDHPDIDVCSSWIEEFVDSPNHVISIRKVPETSEENACFIKSRNPLNHPAVIFRKSAVEKAGGYKHFPLFEDWYLWARMVSRGSKIANIQESLLCFRTSNDMYKRRGGWRYAITSFKFQLELHRLGIITIPQAMKSSTIRGIVYLMPNKIRKLIYNKFLRE